MNQQPDKFFYERLHDYQKPVPGDAWNRVSRNLQKQRRFVWLRAAAAILLLAAATVLLFPVLSDDDLQQLAVNQTEALQENKEFNDSHSEEDLSAIEAPSAVDSLGSLPEKTNQAKPVPNRLPKRKPLIASEVTTSEPSPLESRDIHVTTDGLMSEANPPKQVQEPVVAKGGNITIVFSAEEVNEKYLTKKTDAEATSVDKETSGLKKLLDKAYDLKHNQDPLGDLRQMKNEILAMNFRNDKRTQND